MGLPDSGLLPSPRIDHFLELLVHEGHVGIEVLEDVCYRRLLHYGYAHDPLSILSGIIRTHTSPPPPPEPCKVPPSLRHPS